MENYLTTAAKLQADMAVRAADAVHKTARMAVAAPSSDRLFEGWELVEAAYRRTNAIQVSWIRDWADWVDYARSLEGADTVPKYVERTGNILLQAQAQMASQANEMAELLDNVGVSYAYWLEQQVAKSERG